MKIHHPGIKRYFIGGKEYIYHRKTRMRIRAPWGTEEFAAEIARIEDRHQSVVKDRAKEGTLYHACQLFQSSEQHRNYPLRVRSGFQEVINWLPDRAAAIPLNAVTHSFVRDLRNMAARQRGVRFGNIALGLLHAVLTWSVENSKLKENPAIAVHKVRRPKMDPSRDRRRVALVRAPLAPLSDSTKKDISGG